MSKPRGERFAVVLEAAPHPDGLPAIIRLRHALKTLWRSPNIKLRCVSAEAIPADPETEAATDTDTTGEPAP